MTSRFDCEICGTQNLPVKGNLRKPPTTCATAHKASEYACGECWEAHLSFEVERKHPLKVECMFCTSIIGKKDLGRLARVATLRRYEALLHRTAGAQCIRRCLAGFKDGQFVESARQQHDRETDGPIFTCHNPGCGYKYCLDCERPQHQGQTCKEREARVEVESQHNYNPSTTSIMPSHAEAYAKTKTVFTTCPGCGVFGEIGRGCGYVECKETYDTKGENNAPQYGCSFRFCKSKDCMIAWVGEDSAYLGGPTSHHGKCKYINRAWPSEHTLAHRFEETDPKKAAVLAQRAGKKEQSKQNKQEKSKPSTAAMSYDVDATTVRAATKRRTEEAKGRALGGHGGKRTMQHDCDDIRPIKAAKMPKQQFT